MSRIYFVYVRVDILMKNRFCEYFKGDIRKKFSLYYLRKYQFLTK